MENEGNRWQTYYTSEESKEMSYWLWSNLSQFSDAELEEHKTLIKKVIELRQKIGNHYDTWGTSYYNTILDLENQITKIDEELERRKPSRLLLQNGSFFLLEDGSHLQLEGQVTVPQDHDVMKKDKTITLLQREVEGLTNELEHEKTHSDNQRRTIDWLTGKNGSLYSDVEEDDDE